MKVFKTFLQLNKPIDSTPNSHCCLSYNEYTKDMHTCRTPEEDKTVSAVCEYYQSTVALRDPHLHKCSERQVISEHIHMGFVTDWLLLDSLLECMQTESVFPVIKVSRFARYFPRHSLHWPNVSQTKERTGQQLHLLMLCPSWERDPSSVALPKVSSMFLTVTFFLSF